MLKVNYVADTRPVSSITLVQPKGALDLTMNKNANGKRIRISNKQGNVVSVDLTKLDAFIDGLVKVAMHGAKTSQRA